MQFRYYITDISEGLVKGTNDEKVAKDYAQSDDFFVVDSGTGFWLTSDGGEAIEEAVACDAED